MLGERPDHRGDIDGLRALAVVAVVAFHAGVAGFTGGFVGVDVFFVISGFLITRQLLAEDAATGRIALLAFWGRRVRRLVPALSLVVVVTMVASAVVLAPIDLPEVGRQGLASSLYVSNLLFAHEAGDYFGADLSTSPFLHTWSLGVEEQFYLLWPLLVGGVALVPGRDPARRRRALAVVFAVVAVASFALALWQTPRSPSWAFYGLHARAWEFALAGSLALVSTGRWARLPAAARVATGWGGLAAVGWSVVVLDGTTAYPGTAAAIPVLGALALVVAGTPGPTAPGSVASLLDVAPLRWLGRVSYSWYLWHWPAIVLVGDVVTDAGPLVLAVAALGSLPVAAAAHRLVENPVRFSPRLASSTRRTLGMGATLTVVAVLAATVAPMLAPVEDRDLDVELVAARADRGRDDCPREERTAGIDHCVSGDLDGSRTVLLIGDSHARHWKSALGEAAARSGSRLVDHWHPRCPAVDVVINPPGGGGLDHELVRSCRAHRDETRRLLAELSPDVVVVSDSRGYTPLVLTDDAVAQPRVRQADLWSDRFDDLLDRIEATGAVPVVIRDNPRLAQDPVSCLSDGGDEVSCATPAVEALATIEELDGAERRVLDRRTEEGRPVLTYSVVEDICGGDRCELWDRGVLIYADQGHFTTAFTATRVDDLADLLDEAIHGG